ncbi:TolC family protein [Gillisia sp. M10.2A]|uniref:TolC family protein n=1 Tax=Gillisia lutea TaxID=2909668 RepID=A0ABS9EGA9_9FLAO|nr:TolC family protein [Gillisia lutea]MCF4101929.1 TolC family protein [Gillisia lutea]
MRKLAFLIFFLSVSSLFAQAEDTLRLEFNEYLAIVKKYHPLVKQAGLMVDEGDFKLLKARGSFDPKIEADLSEKNYKSTEYYNIFNSAFKIPTYYGLEFKAKYELNSGYYLNPQNNVPQDGLYSAGVSLDLTDGLFMSKRMAALRQARIYRDQSRIKRDLMSAEILYEASLAYFTWYAAYQKYEFYKDFVKNAEFRLTSVKTEFRAGDKAAVDTLEANIAYESRMLQFQQTELELTKATFNLSNYLWTENNVPLELQNSVIPEENLLEKISQLWIEDEILAASGIQNNPKLQYLEYNVEIKEVDRKLKINQLLPDLSLNYNFLTSEPEEWRRLNVDDYKFGIKLSLPVFMRKERGAVELSKLAVENSRFELLNAGQEISNKLKILQSEISSYRSQNTKIQKMAEDYESLVEAEQRKFELGDSSLFLVNNRENSFLSARMKQIDVLMKFLKSRAELKKLTTNF